MKRGDGLKRQVSLPKLDIGLSDKERVRLGEGLAVLLADTYMLYIKTQNFHWNVTGALFLSLHLTFEKQYQDLAEANDMLAERIRSLGFFAIATCAQFKRLSSISESEGVPNAVSMVQELIQGNEAVIRAGRSLVAVAEEAADYGTADLVTGRLEVHEKAVWMLRSLLSA